MFRAVFGDGAQAFIWDEEWEEINEISYNQGYMVNVMDDVSMSTENVIQKTMTSAYLAPGWNLLANPHLCEYELPNIHFKDQRCHL